MSDDPASPWEALQAPGVAATDGMPVGRLLAYADGTLVGYDTALAVPAQCFSCATRTGLGWLDLGVRRPEVASPAYERAAALAPPPAAAASVLHVPCCAACQRQRRRALRQYWALRAFEPFYLLALVLVGVRLPRVAQYALVVAFFGGLFWARARRAAAVARRLRVVRLDPDGVVRLVAVHPAVVQAILAAAGGAPSG